MRINYALLWYRMNRIRLIPTAQRKITVLGSTELTKDHVLFQCDDDRASYMFTRQESVGKAMPELLDQSRVDWSVMPPPELDAVYKGTDIGVNGLPLSFLRVTTVEEGEQWYREHTKHPECIIPLLARYQWGSLRKGINRKQIKNDRKKAKRRKAKDKAKDIYTVSHEPCVVKFD